MCTKLLISYSVLICMRRQTTVLENRQVDVGGRSVFVVFGECENIGVRVMTEIYLVSESIRLQAWIMTTTEIYELLWHVMAEKFDLRLILEFDSMDPNQSIIEWVEKAELVCRLCMVKKFEFVIPMQMICHVPTIEQRE